MSFGGLMLSRMALAITRLEDAGDGQGPVGNDDLLLNATLMLFFEPEFPYPWLED